MGRLILLDASVAIAALSRDDAHHPAARAAINGAGDADLLICATTRVEVLVGPIRSGEQARRAATAFLAGCITVPVGSVIADDAAALRARHGALCVPDAITIAAGQRLSVDEIWTFDQRWRTVSPLVATPTSND